MDFQPPEIPESLTQDLDTIFGIAKEFYNSGNARFDIFGPPVFFFHKRINIKSKDITIHAPHGHSGHDYIDNVIEFLEQHVCEKHNLQTHKLNAVRFISNGEHVIGSVRLETRPICVGLSFRGWEPLLNKLEGELEAHGWLEECPVVRQLTLDRSKGSITHKTTVLPEQMGVSDPHTMYPFLDHTPAEVWESFSTSDSNVLLLLGEPGTGKSSFIREMMNIRGWGESVYVADNHSVLDSGLLSEFIKDGPLDSVYIVEDSDKFIASREEGNSEMSTLLNAVSGIVPTRTKIIISANVPNLKQVDPALLRPGRTFKIMEFEELTIEQGYAVREMFDLEEVELTSVSGRLTLAEALNQNGPVNQTQKRATIGFG